MSQKGIGRLIQVGIAKETTRGTTPGSASYWTPFEDLNIDEKQEKTTDVSAYGIIEDAISMSNVKQWSEGSIQGIIGDQTFGLFLLSVFGTLASHSAHSGESSVYDNKYTVQEGAQHQSLSFYLHDPLSGQDYSYGNGVVSKLEITYALKQFVKFNAMIKALKGVTQSSYSPSTTTENHFVPQYLTLGIALNLAGAQSTLTATGTCATTIHVTACSINPQTNLRVGMTVTGTNIPAGATVATIVSATAFDLSVASTGSAGSYTFGPAVIKVKSAKITIDQSIEDQEVIGSTAPADFLNKEYKIEGTVEAIWQNETDFKTQFMVNTPIAMHFDLKNTDVTIGSATNPEFILDFPKCYITELGRPLKVKDLVYQTIKFKAVYSVSDTEMVNCTLTNTVNGY